MATTFQIFEFNQKRNKFVLNTENEKAMLLEEVQEFFQSETTADRVDAMVDFNYVLQGTKMKFANSGEVFSADLYEWVEESLHIMKKVLAEELEDLVPGYGDDAFHTIMLKAQKIVADVNALKGANLDENGKVQKGIDIPNATIQIAEMIPVELKRFAK